MEDTTTKDRITEEELAYVQECQQQVQEVQQAFVAAQGALGSYTAYLSRKYGLNEGDSIEPGGLLVRSPQASGE